MVSTTLATEKEQFKKERTRREHTHTFIQFIDFIENAMLLKSKKRHPKIFMQRHRV